MPRKEPGFAERLQTAVKAKQAQLEKSRATASANDPQAAARQAALKLDQKAARDSKYAARKARQK